jgi:hypothetical protein
MLPHEVESVMRPDLIKFISRAIFSLSFGSTEVGFFWRLSHSLTCQTLSIVHLKFGFVSATRIEIVMRKRRDVNGFYRTGGKLRLRGNIERQQKYRPDNR